MSKKILLGGEERRTGSIIPKKGANGATGGRGRDGRGAGELRAAPVENVALERIKRAAYNPRRTLQPGDPEYQKLKRSMGTFGLVDPPVWNKRTGNLVGGHQRLEVLRREYPTMIEVACAVVDLDLEREKALNLALNKIEAGWDDEKLCALLDELRESVLDETVTGFDEEEIDAMLAEVADLKSEGSGSGKTEQLGGMEYRIIVECRNETHQRKLLARFEREKITCRPLIS